MNSKEITDLITPFRFAVCIFCDYLVHDGAIEAGDSTHLKRYHYKFRPEQDITVGDDVVVYASGDLKIVRVVDVIADPSPDIAINYKWLLDKINLDAANQFAADQRAIQQDIRKAQAKAAKRATLQELSPEVLALVRKYDGSNLLEEVSDGS